MKQKKTHEQYVKEVAKLHPNIEVLEKYKNAKTKILYKCKLDGHEWHKTPDHVLRGQGCPVCAGRIIGNAPEYKNSIWASEYKQIFSQYMTEEQMKQYMPQSSQEATVTCPLCGRPKDIIICNLFKRKTISCICHDSLSYPNKFIYNLLEQLNVVYVSEKSFIWSNGRIYDIYIPSMNCIIENHGIQHYDGGFSRYGGRTLQDEQENDNYKKQLAIKNGIANYFIIDCRKSDKEWIKNSVESAGLLDFISYEDKSIDWDKCDEFATSSLIKAISALWNEGYTMQQITRQLKISYLTAQKYLAKAVEFEWCDYSIKNAYKRAGENRIGKNNSRAHKVIRLADGKIYDTVQECAIENKLHRRTIGERCKINKDFMYYENYLMLYG